LSNDSISEAIELIENGKENNASKILARIVLDNPQDETAWFWLSKCLEEPRKKRFCLEKVLEINPNNQHALEDLNALSIYLDDINPSFNNVEIREESPRSSSVTPMQCPNCGEKISPEDKVCRSCGYNLIPLSLQPTRPSKPTLELSRSITRPDSQRKKRAAKRIRLWLLLILIVAVLIGSWLVGPSLFRSIRSFGPFIGSQQTTSAPIIRQEQATPSTFPTTSMIIPVPSPSTLITQENQVEEWEGVKVGMCAGSVLLLHTESEFVKQPQFLGTDSDGFIVKWTYADAYLILARRWGKDEIYCYRVQEIQLIDQ